MLDDLLQKGVIKLLELKITEQVERMANPLYRQYHRMVSLPLEK